MAKRRFITPPTKTLTDQQKYLLQRLPRVYELKGKKPVPEPPDVKAARRLVAQWDERQRKQSCKSKCEAEKALLAAKEAIYFKPVEYALEAVKAVESYKQCCGGN